MTAAHPTGTVNFSVSNGTGTFSPLSCTLTNAVAAADSTCTVTYTPTTFGLEPPVHTLKATYAGDTAPIQFASSFGTDTLTINRPPTADRKSVSVTHKTSRRSITLAGSDVDGNAQTFSIVTDPTHGTLGSIGPSPARARRRNCSASVTYTPNAGFTGSDSFTFKTNDGLQDSSAATVSITVVQNTATTTNASSATATYGDASVLLSATVTAASTVNTGTVTFTLKNGATTIGTATTANVASGIASVNYSLPAGTAAGPYTIFADYSGATGLAASADHTAC